MKQFRRALAPCVATVLMWMFMATTEAAALPAADALTLTSQRLENLGVKNVAPDHWAAWGVVVLVSGGLTQPDASGNIQIDAAIPGSQAIGTLARVLGIAAKADSPAVATEKMREAGLIDSSFVPAPHITRLETARILARAVGSEQKPLSDMAEYPFKDPDAVTSVNDAGLLRDLYSLGLFKGYEDGTFRPDASLTLAQLAVLVDRLFGGPGPRAPGYCTTWTSPPGTVPQVVYGVCVD